MNIGDFLKHNGQNIGINSTLSGQIYKCFSPFQSSVAFHIETSHLICNANQMIGFFMKCKTGLKWVNLQNKSMILFKQAKHDLNNAFRVN